MVLALRRVEYSNVSALIVSVLHGADRAMQGANRNGVWRQYCSPDSAPYCHELVPRVLIASGGLRVPCKAVASPLWGDGRGGAC